MSVYLTPYEVPKETPSPPRKSTPRRPRKHIVVKKVASKTPCTTSVNHARLQILTEASSKCRRTGKSPDRTPKTPIE